MSGKYLQTRMNHFWHYSPFFQAPLWIRICPMSNVIKFYEKGLMYVIVI
jgi:hypothetical protein